MNEEAASCSRLLTALFPLITERTETTMKSLFVAICLIAVTGPAALAEGACKPEIEKTKSDWQALHLVGGGKPGSMVWGVGGHHHIDAAITSMRIHLAAAQQLCGAGKDHESLLHLDVLRAFLQLPEIQHPADHRFLFDPKAK